ncbi:VOC family protein [Chitinophaga vietnamensis]|uniref:VOC family protein n=1 Tax=Chitinophaga vietnamensis TaxID=2593957 RepID=UPI001177519A|nr:VOC family protein [Chitinophaga vietnamensis]
MTNTTLRGIATISFFAADHEAAKQWYSEVLGIAPYFEVPGYAEFRVGDYQQELGIIDSRYAQHPVGQPAGAILYWHVDDLPATLERLTGLGASVQEPVKERGHGFVTAAVKDPFGNILGIMYNPHYLEILASFKK